MGVGFVVAVSALHCRRGSVLETLLVAMEPTSCQKETWKEEKERVIKME